MHVEQLLKQGDLGKIVGNCTCHGEVEAAQKWKAFRIPLEFVHIGRSCADALENLA